MERTLSTAKTLEFSQQPIPAAWPLRVLATLLLWSQRARTRRQLAMLDERQLSDIGMSISTRAAEVDTPFWR
ncbi:MAG TPA: DUF1127 domain-containing protein [Pseudomonas sp.]|nr:DUF1127 domain-containing protein [Pseudomonas sp.]